VLEVTRYQGPQGVKVRLGNDMMTDMEFRRCQGGWKMFRVHVRYWRLVEIRKVREIRSQGVDGAGSSEEGMGHRREA
jgi:hypothetical protein